MNNSKMDLQIEEITTSISFDETKIIKIQKWFKGCLLRPIISLHFFFH